MKDKKMSKYGKKGIKGLIKSLGNKEEIRKYYQNLAKKRWKKHPEQRSKAYKSKLIGKVKMVG